MSKAICFPAAGASALWIMSVLALSAFVGTATVAPRAVAAGEAGAGKPSNEAAAGKGLSEDGDLQRQLAVAGREIAVKNCARCHGVGMDDASPHKAAPPFRDVVERYPSENLAEALAEGIVSGHPDMPVFVFEPDEIEAFIAYLDSLTPPQ